VEREVELVPVSVLASVLALVLVSVSVLVPVLVPVPDRANKTRAWRPAKLATCSDATATDA
jgi:hypothetical protein